MRRRRVLQRVVKSLVWSPVSSSGVRDVRSQVTSRATSWAMKLLIIPIGPSFVLPFGVVCKEQKYLQVTIALTFSRVSNSLAVRKVVGEKVSFPIELPLIKIVLDVGWFSQSRNLPDRMIHLTRSSSSRLSSLPLFRQRCRS